jgi:hypothetical protein
MCAAGPFTVKVNCSPGRILEQPHFLQLIEFVQIVAKKFEEIFEQSRFDKLTPIRSQYKTLES